MVQAWMLDDSTLVPSSPHKKTPNEPVDIKSLEKIGVTFEKLNPDETNYKEDPKLLEYCKEREFSFSDILTVSQEGLKNYEKTLKCFYKEHFHPDDESRYVIEGCGYFDVRNEKDEWVRILVEKGDLFTLPAGMYHRFALDESHHFLKSVRMFVADPIWTPLYREESEDHFSRKEYLKKYKIKL